MSIELIDKIKPKNNGSFALVEAHDIQMPDGSRLDTWEGKGTIPYFDLVTLGLADIPMDGTAVKLETDTTEIIAALQNGAVRFRVKASYGGVQFDLVFTMHDISTPAGGQYLCSYAFGAFSGFPMLVNITVKEGSISATCTVLGADSGEDVAAEIPTFDLTALGLPSVPVTGEQVGVATDTTDILAALDKGNVRFSLALSDNGADTPFDVVMAPMRATVSEDMTTYMCSHAVTYANGEILNIMLVSGQIVAMVTPVGGATAETPATSIDLSALDSAGKVVETYADGTSKTTTLEFDENGNPVKITDGDGNVTTLIW